jgi:drug/metabolite transporter (DMT)-like permease
MQPTEAPEQSRVLPIAVLLVNALIWGLSWWPLRALQEAGWHPLWSTTLVFLLGALAIVALKPAAVLDVCRSPLLLGVGVVSGLTNGAFNWGITVGDVVRVILLFYLMPVWAAIAARLFLKEKITVLVLVRIVLALTGAAIVLRPEGGGIPLPSTAGDWLGLFGGMAFALTNVSLRHAARCDRYSRAFAMFAGGVLIPGLCTALITATGRIAVPDNFGPQVCILILALGAAMLVANSALQFGAARLPVNTTSVVMLTEVVFAALSSVLLIGAVVTPSMLAGGLLIVLSSGLSALPDRSAGRRAS